MTAVMTPPPDTAARRRRRAVTAALLAGLVLIVAIVVVLIVTTRHLDSATPAPTSPLSTIATTAAPSTDQQGADGSTVLADGCLGGPDPFTAIVPAQHAATHDTLGAAALARAFGRWSVTYPIDPAAPQVLAAIVTPGNPFEGSALESLNQLARTLQAQGYTESRVLPDQSSYRIQPGSTDTSVTLDLLLYRQLTRSDGRTEEMRMAITVLLERTEDGPWFISGTLPPLGSDPFAPSTAAPWLTFQRAC